MCLAVPMKIEEIEGQTAVAGFESNLHRIDVSMLERIEPGEYVIVHAGFAIAKLDRMEAEERIELFRQLADSWRSGKPGP